MGLTEGVLPWRLHLKGLIFAFHNGDHLFACAAVTRNCVAGNGVVLGENACLNKRIAKGDESACVAAGNGNSLGIADIFSVLFTQLGETVVPCGICSVRCRCVDDPDIWIGAKVGCFSCGCIWQAEEREI